MTWGPFVARIDPAGRKSRFRSLRTCVNLLTGPRGQDANLALLRAEIADGDPDTLRKAETEFGRLGSHDQRRILASFAEVQSPNLKVVRHG